MPNDARSFGLAGRALITRVRFFLPNPWKPVLGYLDLERKMQETGNHAPDARQIFDWGVAIRSAKLPDPAVIGNAGSFFKNPTVTPEQCADIIARDPKVVHYPMPDGGIKLAAGWLIDRAGLKGHSEGRVGIHPRQALVIINLGGATGTEIVAFARKVQEQVKKRFGVEIEPEVNIL